MRASVIVAVLVATTALAASAEDLPPIPVGTHMRVTSSGAGGFTGTFEGTLVKLDPRELTLVDGEKGAVMTVPAASVTRVQILTARHRKTRKGLLIGLAAGAALGAFAGSTDPGDGSGCGLNPSVYKPCTAGTAAAWAALTGISGAAIGALIGVFGHTETWTEVGLERVQVQVAPTRGGGRLSMSFSF